MDTTKLHKIFKDNGAFSIDDQGRKQGYMLTFHSNDCVSGRYAFKDDVRHGISKTYYENGALRTMSVYNQGKLHGEYRRYDNCGNLQFHSIYNHGVRAVVLRDNGNSNSESNVITLF